MKIAEIMVREAIQAAPDETIGMATKRTNFARR